MPTCQNQGFPHKGGSPVPPLQLRMNKNGFQVTHPTETQKKKTQSISLTRRESSANPSIVFSFISGSEKEVRKA